MEEVSLDRPGRQRTTLAVTAALAMAALLVLPDGPYFGALAVRPRALWTLVLVFCALNYASYVARRVVGARKGYAIAGALGGLLSSTAVTLTNARQSRIDRDDAPALASGVIAACSVLIPRILVVSAFLDPAVALVASLYLILPLATGVLIILLGNREAEAPAPVPAEDKNPLRFVSALQMAVAFQVALSAITVLRPMAGNAGIYGVAVALGLTDMDALTVSMSSKATMVPAVLAGRALAVGVLANTAFKMGISVVVGTAGFRRRAAAGLGAIAVATALGLFLL